MLFVYVWYHNWSKFKLFSLTKDFVSVIFVIVFAIQNPICVEENHEAEEAASDELQVKILIKFYANTSETHNISIKFQ